MERVDSLQREKSFHEKVVDALEGIQLFSVS